jgi:hypothetical protein
VAKVLMRGGCASHCGSRCARSMTLTRPLAVDKASGDDLEILVAAEQFCELDHRMTQSGSRPERDGSRAAAIYFAVRPASI